MEMTTSSNDGASNKKQKLDGGGEQTSDAEQPPQYGSKEYWEERYQRHRKLEECDNNEASEDSDAVPYHEWYFTFAELSPLILPLILGSGTGADDLEDGDPDGDSRVNDSQERANIEEHSVAVANEDSEPVGSDESSHTINNIPDTEQEELAEDEEEEEKSEEREGLAKDGPISILEIGCGDRPLGRDLAMELAEFEEKTGASADSIIKRVVCCDYSSTVIDLCKENQRQDLQVGASQKGGGVKHGAVDYVTADARDLPYPDNSFQMIMEKGTLDAMLSDKEIGKSNCIKIMADCARVLNEGGYILLVSHINAHTQNGIDWLDSVIITGLRTGAGTQSKWEIEVHGSDGTEDVVPGDHAAEENGGDVSDVDFDEAKGGKAAETLTEFVSIGGNVDSTGDAGEASDRNENGTGGSLTSVPSGSPGPAVYIIHNISKPAMATKQSVDQHDSDDSPTIPLKFFSY